MEKVHVDGKIIMNKKCIYYETCYESHTECLCGKECEDYEPITERRGNKAEREHLKRCIEISNKNNYMDE